MMLKRALVVVAAGLSLSACAVSTSHDVVRDAVSTRLFLYQQPVDGAAILQVVRDNGLFGAGCGTQLSIDGQLAAQFQQGEQASFYLSPGNHSVIARSVGTCQAQQSEISANLNAGQRQILQIGSHGKTLQWAAVAHS